MGIILRYIRFWLRSRNRYGIHSPFVFDLVNNVFRNTEFPQELEPIAVQRAKALADHSTIEVTDLGAGSRISKGNIRKISSIVENAAITRTDGMMFFHLIKLFQPKTILELGTSLGFSSAFMSIAAPNARIITIEGCPNIAEYARTNHKALGLSNIEIVVGDFDEILPDLLKNIDKLDLVFIDGNHAAEPTLRYYDLCMTKTDDESILVFDDIHWSSDMENAWKSIKRNLSQGITVDIFRKGLVFPRNDRETEHFSIRY